MGKRYDRSQPYPLSCLALWQCLLIIVGFLQSWSLSLAILNLCLISAIMALGVNIQWGYAGLVNFGVMGFSAVGRSDGCIDFLSHRSRSHGKRAAWHVLLSTLLTLVAIAACVAAYRNAYAAGRNRQIGLAAMLVISFFGIRAVFYDPAVKQLKAPIRPLRVSSAGLACPS